MNILFFTLIDEQKQGYMNKVKSQVSALKKLGHNVTYSYTSKNNLIIVKENTEKQFICEKNSVLLKRRYAYKSILDEVNPVYDVILIRFNYFDLWIRYILRKAKKCNIKVVIEVPTYPYRNELINNVFISIKKRNIISFLKASYKIVSDFYISLFIKRYVYRTFTYSPINKIWGIQCIEIDNGIHLDDINTHCNAIKNEYKVIAVAVGYFQKWHAYERILEGMQIYYSKEQSTVFEIIFVGLGPELEKYENLTKRYNLTNYVRFIPPVYGQELDSIFNSANIAISSLGGHTRPNNKPYSPLKSREYCARGIPFIYSYNDKIFDSYNDICYKNRIGKMPIDVDQIIQFYRCFSAKNMMKERMIMLARNSFSWETQLSEVIKTIEEDTK